ncbi:MAG: winged helix DNA-binding domain-containing protein [Taibaiella sp.]|nr:winged helix DNA-binding domain-containing protein [Taibaiella sp.]
MPSPKHSGNVYFLPAFDEYTVAYKDKSILSPSFGKDEKSSKVLNPVVVHKGAVAGSWKRTAGKKKTTIDVTLLSPPDPKLRVALENAAKSYCRFAGYEEHTLTLLT